MVLGEFGSLQSYSHFEQSVKAEAQIATGCSPALQYGEHTDEVREFLKNVLDSSVPRQVTLAKDQLLFRAQKQASTWTTEPVRIGIGEESGEIESDVEVADCSPKRMLPDAEKVPDGRANRRGIPYLYLAFESKTALAETRPWVDSSVTLAQFQLTRSCCLVDCSLNTARSIYLEVLDLDKGEHLKEPDCGTKEVGVWGDIGYAFSKPVTRDDDLIEYVPTQILAEEFRRHGYDGIVYKSLLDGGGKNVVLFDLTSARLLKCCLYKTKTLSYEFSRADENLYCRDSISSRVASVVSAK